MESAERRPGEDGMVMVVLVPLDAALSISPSAVIFEVNAEQLVSAVANVEQMVKGSMATSETDEGSGGEVGASVDTKGGDGGANVSGADDFEVVVGGVVGVLED